MFTGLVQDIGEISNVGAGSNGTTCLAIKAPMFAGDIKIGESISVSGVCLTVTAHRPKDLEIEVEVMGETLARSSLGDKSVGDKVNLERALLATDRLGGHIVQGHVDTTANVIALRDDPAWRIIEFTLGDDFRKYIVEKGSITLDGVSLTVAGVDKTPGSASFEVALIPTTLNATTLGQLGLDSKVNVEFDVMAKYAESIASA
jgi:riboflavin synthase